MVSVATLGPEDPGSSPGWFSLSNSNKKLSYYFPIIQNSALNTNNLPKKTLLSSYKINKIYVFPFIGKKSPR